MMGLEGRPEGLGWPGLWDSLFPSLARRLHLWLFPPQMWGGEQGRFPRSLLGPEQSQCPAQEAGAAPSSPSPTTGLSPPLLPNDPHPQTPREPALRTA